MTVIYKVVQCLDAEGEDEVKLASYYESKDKAIATLNHLYEKAKSNIEEGADPKSEESIKSIVTDTSGSFNDNDTQYVVLDADESTYIGYSAYGHEDIYYIECLPAVYALLSLNYDLINYPTDLIGIFNSMSSALDSGSQDMKYAFQDSGVTEDQFNEEPKMSVLLTPVGEDIDYQKGIGWNLELQKGQVVPVRNN